jgi:molybdopterin synthase catalytic subunit
MKRQVDIVSEPIDEPSLRARRMPSVTAGAVVNFLGVVRDRERESLIVALDYEAFREMAEHQFELIFQQIEQRWPIESIRLVHRIGRVKAGEPSLWVEVLAPHRGEAFAACEYLIDEMKRVVPIWKRPVASEGKQQPGKGSLGQCGE